MDDYDSLAAKAILDPEPDEERGEDAHRSPARRKRRKAEDDLFSPTPLWWLHDKRFHKFINARSRVYHRLWFETYEGTEPARVTNVLAAELGLPKQNKMRELRWFEREGFLVMELDGNRTPIIRLLPLSRSEAHSRTGVMSLRSELMSRRKPE